MTKISVTQVIKELKEEKLTVIEIQRVLKARGFDWSLDDIESIPYVPLLSCKDVPLVDEIDEIMKSLVDVWERYKIHNLPMPQHTISSIFHQAYFRYQKVSPEVNRENLSILSKLGLGALDYLTKGDTIGTEFWKPLYARWYHVKHPLRTRKMATKDSHRF